jgi:hypothetical protein
MILEPGSGGPGGGVTSAEIAMSVLYFAYGSNLKWTRMRQRIPSARREAIAFLDRYRLVCNKRGRDGSAKANLVRAMGRAQGVDLSVRPAHARSGPL